MIEKFAQGIFSQVEIRDYNVMTDGKNFFDESVKNDMRTYDNIWKMSTDQWDDYTSGSWLDSNYFIKYYKMIATDLCKRPAFDSDPNTIKQINLNGNLENESTIFFIIEEVKETVLDFSQGTVKIF